MAIARRKTALGLIIGTLSLVVTGIALAMPGPVSCGLVAQFGLERLENGTRVQPSASPQQRELIKQLQTQAQNRIAQSFGAPQAQPILVFMEDASAFFPLAFNAYGSTHFIGEQACVVIGPKGINVDVIAHELMHAELLARVGFWQRMIDVPIWFDEGIAMQVDWRADYDLPAGQNATIEVRNLQSVRQFNQPGKRSVREHYAFAKAEVAAWLAATGRERFYKNMERIRAGESFATVVGP